MRKRLIGTLLVSALLLSCLTACGNSASSTSTSSPSDSGAKETVTLKLATEMADGSPEADATYAFADNVYEQTNGEVKIDVYTSGQLGDPATVIESAQLGNVDIIILPASDFKSFDEIFGMEAVPFLYADNDSVAEILKESGAADTQKEILKENGLILLNEARNAFRGPYRVLVSKTPIRTIDDLKGLRFRTFENKNYNEAYTILGANPIVIAYSETYMALQNGLADACTCAISDLKSQHFTEVAPYVTNINEYVSTVLLLAGSSTYDALSEENQAILKSCADQFGEDLEELSLASLQGDLDELEAAGVEFIDIDTAPAREALKDFYYSLEESGALPAGTVDIVLAQ